MLAWLLRSLEAHAGLVFLAASAPWEPADALGQTRFVSLKFLPPTYAERLQLWQVALQGAGDRQARMSTCPPWPIAFA